MTGVSAAGAATGGAQGDGSGAAGGRIARTPSSRSTTSACTVIVAERSSCSTSRSGSFAAIVLRAISAASTGSVRTRPSSSPISRSISAS
jgi:hypothetical protein